MESRGISQVLQLRGVPCFLFLSLHPTVEKLISTQKLPRNGGPSTLRNSNLRIPNLSSVHIFWRVKPAFSTFSMVERLKHYFSSLIHWSKSEVADRGVYLCEGSLCSSSAQLGSHVAVGTNQAPWTGGDRAVPSKW